MVERVLWDMFSIPSSDGFLRRRFQVDTYVGRSCCRKDTCGTTNHHRARAKVVRGGNGEDE